MIIDKKLLLLILVMISLCSFVYSGDGCCFTTSDNQICTYVDDSLCPPNSFAEGVACTDIGFCRPGCCYNEVEGVYDDMSTQSSCSKSWSNEPCDNIPGSEEGCCTFGESSNLVTKKKCETKYGTEALWDDTIGMQECMMSGLAEDWGACILNDGGCEFTIGANCNPEAGAFYPSDLCSNPSLDSGCGPSDDTECFEGKVYFLDSCGERANIYDSTRRNDLSYWDRIIEPENSCSPGTNGAANSANCGNCERQFGGICSSASEEGFDVDIGNYYCRDTSCIFNGTRYENGESWCVYDGVVGDGNDSVGSLHWFRSCSDGIIQLDVCGERRDKICIQSNVVENGKTFRNASCVKNDWLSCLKTTDKALCEENPFCSLKEVSVDVFKFTACVPNYPAGFNFDRENSEQRNLNAELCDYGSVTCTVTYEKELESGLSGTFGDTEWNCVQNCGCRDIDFAEKMNDICKSLGDCGGYVNYQGAYTDNGYSFSGELIDNGCSYDWKNKVWVCPPNNKIRDSKILEYMKNINPIANFIIEKLVFKEYSDLEGETGINSNSEYYDTGGFGGLSEKYINRVNRWGFMVNFYDPSVGNIITSSLGVGDTETRNVNFKCKPWTPPSENYSCESCNNVPGKPCSEYRCSSIGISCKILNKGKTDEMCYDSRESDETPPVISVKSDAISDGYKYNNINNKGFGIEPVGGGCVEAWDNVTFGINTDELALCKYDIKPNNFDNMTDFGSGSFAYNHTQSYKFPSIEFFNAADPTQEWKDWTFYIKCQNAFGKTNTDFYTVNTCLNDAPDLASKGVQKIIPESGSMVSYDGASQNISVYPWEGWSTCRWDFTDKEYSSMEYSMDCNSFSCSASLLIGSSDNIYYIRCMDQSWLEALDRGAERNADTSSKKYELKKPDKKITIDSIGPTDGSVFKTAANSKNFNFEIRTSGGGEEHVCKYRLSENKPFIELWQERVRGLRSWELNFKVGMYTIYVECTDELGDSARAQTSFEISKSNLNVSVDDIDDFISGDEKNNVTIIVRTSGGGTEHNCSYSVGGGWKDFDDLGGIGTVQQEVEVGTGDIKIDVKCKDEFENPGSASVSFNIEYDNTPPVISRIWQSGGQLNVVTIEDNECRYSMKNCDFEWINGTSMGSNERHTISGIIRGKTYYIKCEDEFGNSPNGCSVTVRAL